VEFWLSILFILVIKKGANFGLGFLALCLYLLIYNEDGNLQVTSHNYFIVLNSGLLRGLASFLLGVITYRLYLTYTIKLETLFGPTMMELAATGACLVIFIWREQVFSSIDFLAPLVFSATIFVFSFEQGLVSKFLRPARYIGQISYSIYLNHIAVIMMMAYFTQTYNLSFEVFFYSTIALVLGYSHLTYCYIEKPMQIKLRNIFSRR
jgi:peptidoglycan/LPS O-acetylase OafA/YrhL